MPFTNSYSNEGIISGNKTIAFPWRPRHLQITNDSPTKDLKYRFHESESYRTLKPYETSSLEGINIKILYLNGNGDYRVWSTG